ncbi:hypothetical protein [Pedosphaera parvula]|uniref:Uncharacterized protein n=1 Tax=Pedosphaera parvula (strain Ellin514) TaxID=320771 RepID=B9XAF8_PEDPL|nr:hypothetical protein [Pedosphaera parvula]EEF62993.1 hypothetical protein Cflav_PD5628 [Pedosphaera parvula Ellin514]
MPYNFNHKNARINDAPIVGWYLALPFSFSNPDGNGYRSAVAYYQRLVFVVEFSMDQASTEAFSTWTKEDLRESGSIQITPANSGGATLDLTGVNLEPSFAQHTVQSAKTILWF